MERPVKVPNAVQDIFRQYVDAVRDCLVVSERCYLKGWPDRKAEVLNAVRVVRLNYDLQLLRLEYLVRVGSLEPAMWKSISAISDRIWKDWKDNDETALKEKSQLYRDILAQLDAGRAVADPAAMEGPIAGAGGDPEYLKASEDLRKKYWALDADLQKLAGAPSSGG